MLMPSRWLSENTFPIFSLSNVVDISSCWVTATSDSWEGMLTTSLHYFTISFSSALEGYFSFGSCPDDATVSLTAACWQLVWNVTHSGHSRTDILGFKPGSELPPGREGNKPGPSLLQGENPSQTSFQPAIFMIDSSDGLRCSHK